MVILSCKYKEGLHWNSSSLGTCSVSLASIPWGREHCLWWRGTKALRQALCFLMIVFAGQRIPNAEIREPSSYLVWNWNQKHTVGSQWYSQNTGDPQETKHHTDGHGTGLQSDHRQTTLTSETSYLWQPKKVSSVWNDSNAANILLTSCRPFPHEYTELDCHTNQFLLPYCPNPERVIHAQIKPSCVNGLAWHGLVERQRRASPRVWGPWAAHNFSAPTLVYRLKMLLQPGTCGASGQFHPTSLAATNRIQQRHDVLMWQCRISDLLGC